MLRRHHSRESCYASRKLYRLAPIADFARANPVLARATGRGVQLRNSGRKSLRTRRAYRHSVNAGLMPPRKRNAIGARCPRAQKQGTTNSAKAAARKAREANGKRPWAPLGEHITVAPADEYQEPDWLAARRARENALAAKRMQRKDVLKGTIRMDARTTTHAFTTRALRFISVGASRLVDQVHHYTLTTLRYESRSRGRVRLRELQMCWEEGWQRQKRCFRARSVSRWGRASSVCS